MKARRLCLKQEERSMYGVWTAHASLLCKTKKTFYPVG